MAPDDSISVTAFLLQLVGLSRQEELTVSMIFLATWLTTACIQLSLDVLQKNVYFIQINNLAKRLNHTLKYLRELKISLVYTNGFTGVTQGMNDDSFLKVDKVDEDNRVVMYPVTELELDYGPEIMKKVITIDPDLLD